MSNKTSLILLLGLLLLSKAALSAKPNDLLTSLNSTISPLNEDNYPLLFQRLVEAYDIQYSRKKDPLIRNLANDQEVYYLRQEIQSLIDMYRATDNQKYIITAYNLVKQSIFQAEKNAKSYIIRGKTYGIWPCFFSKSLKNATNGHSQIADFQASAGFMMVASILHEKNMIGWDKIADFVEHQVLEKYFNYIENSHLQKLNGPDNLNYLFAVLHTARDKREHFACICMDMHKLGRTRYPYGQWAETISNLYMIPRKDLSQSHPQSKKLGKLVPKEWGLVKRTDTGGFQWYWQIRKKLVIQDTSHANRTVWTALKGYESGIVDPNIVKGLINTFNKQIWKPGYKTFFFTNYLHGKRTEYLRSSGITSPPGFKGLVYFGWHRLAAYDDNIKDIYISMGYDITNGAKNFPEKTQNISMENAKICYLAWAARLISENQNQKLFP